MSKVRWLQPIIRRGVIVWPDPCEERVVTPQTVTWRQHKGTGTHCLLRAKIDYRGVKVCLNHAKIRALNEIAGDAPTFMVQQ